MNAKRSREGAWWQRFRGLAQDLVLLAQALDLSPLLAQFDTLAFGRGDQVAVIA